MSLPTAQKFAWSLAKSLMTSITLFKAADGYSAMPSAEYDGDPETIVHEYDPF